MKTHSFDALSFIFGSVFTAIGLVFLSSVQPWELLFDGLELGWVLPALVLVGGVMLLVSVLRPEDADTTVDHSDLDSAQDELPDRPSI